MESNTLVIQQKYSFTKYGFLGAAIGVVLFYTFQAYLVMHNTTYTGNKFFGFLEVVIFTIIPVCIVSGGVGVGIACICRFIYRLRNK